jgi:hypothetical protein
MSPIETAGNLLRALPRPVRRWAYLVWAVIGLVLTVLEFQGVESLGSYSVSQALQLYVLLSPALGGVAVANAREVEPEPDVPEAEDDVDLSSFQPIDDTDDIFV